MLSVYPFLMLLLVGLTLESSLLYPTKLVILTLAASTVPFTRRYFYGKRARIRVRFVGLLLFFIFCYSTWFVYVRPLMFGYNFYSFMVVLGTAFSYYYLYRSVFSDPGYLPHNCHDARKNEKVLSLVEKNHDFCAACIVRKPLRSKHCAVCNRCVSKLDHHCPWVNNCIGENNAKYFVLFCIWSQTIFFLYLQGVANCRTNSYSTFYSYSQIINLSLFLILLRLL